MRHHELLHKIDQSGHIVQVDGIIQRGTQAPYSLMSIQSDKSDVFGLQKPQFFEFWISQAEDHINPATILRMRRTTETKQSAESVL